MKPHTNIASHVEEAATFSRTLALPIPNARCSGHTLRYSGSFSRRDPERYKRLLLAKLEELSATRTEAESPAVAAGALKGDLIDQANADAEAGLQVRLDQPDARLLRAIEEALAPDQARHLRYVKARNRSPKPD